MFTAKRQPATTRAETKTSATKPENKTTGKPAKNAFLKAASVKAAETRSGNGSLKFSTTNNAFLDQFATAGSFKAPREYTLVEKDQSTLYGIDARLSVCFILYLRLITRVVQLFDGTPTSTAQRGQGLKHEAIMRMIWLAVNRPNAFWKNIQLFIAVGSWKDIITMLQYDLSYNGWNAKVLDWSKMGSLLKAGLENPKTSNLVKKYLPQLRTNSACKTVDAQSDNSIAKWLCAELFGVKENANNASSYKKYRLLKVGGNAHSWQQLISKGLAKEVNFDTVHGRALSLLVSSKFIKNQGLQAKYTAWLAKKPAVKFTGYVHELFAKIPVDQFQIDTVNKQFQTLVDKAKEDMVDSTGMIVVRDTSGSMNSLATGTKMHAGDIAKAIALFMSYLLPSGPFANSWIEFDSNATMHQWAGSTPMEKWRNDNSNYVGSTNFLAAIDILCGVKKGGVPEDQFPSGIICISDMEFNTPTGNAHSKTSLAAAYGMLKKAGFSEQYIINFKMVFWNITSSAYGGTAGKKFETGSDDVRNVFYFGGYDPSTIAFLTGLKGKDTAVTPTNAEELFQSAMDQEILNMVEV